MNKKLFCGACMLITLLALLLTFVELCSYTKLNLKYVELESRCTKLQAEYNYILNESEDN